ncbi:MAG: head GIN domain-containing protein [Alphaproteobacteria bacterium]|nr:head GIN domain-containing protein [Alphaproteobacteria bacterium]
MRTTVILSAAIAGVAAITAAPVFAETKSFNLSNFDAVAASAGVEVILRQGPFAIRVDEPRGDFDKLELEVKGGTLIVSRKSSSGWFQRGPDYTVTVTAPVYDAISAKSGSDVQGENLSLQNVEVKVSSGANLELSGTCATMTLAVSSGADFEGESLRCTSASVDASSGADADAFATVKAVGDASSGADITFHGQPATFEKDTSSGGSVRAL